MPDTSNRSSLSIVVPTYKSGATLGACLEAIRGSLDSHYELIVVDDGNPGEDAYRTAKRYTNTVIRHSRNLGRSEAKNTGLKHSTGDILVFIDSDVVVKPDSISLIKDYFQRHPDIDALFGSLSKLQPHDDFFSQYKNFYMYHILAALPEHVNFIYGSIHAVRRTALLRYNSDVKIADDTALGQSFFSQGKKIAFVRNLQVTHLKKYSLMTFIKNDFCIPFDWTKIFIKYAGWRQLGRNASGYLHSPKEQLLSIVLAPIIFTVALFSCRFSSMAPIFIGLLAAWYLLNYNFLFFLFKEKGALFGLVSLGVTFFDHLDMAAAIGAGFITHSYLLFSEHSA